MAFRVEVCADNPDFAADVIGRTRDAAVEAGVAGLVEVVEHNHVFSSLAVALVAASDRDAGPQLTKCVTDALAGEQPVIPVIDDVATWQRRLPAALGEMNAIALSDASAGRKILESAGVLVPLRGVFLSHRRSDGGAMALQLASELRVRGLATFVDVLDIRPTQVVQERITSALDQMACLVLLESPDAIQSEWVMKEVVYAAQRQLGTIALSWAPEDPSGGPPTRFRQFDSGNRLDVRPYIEDGRPSEKLTEQGVDLAISAILREFAQALYFRRANLQRELQAVVPSVRLLAPWRFVLEGPDRRRLIGLAPYRPDALDLHALAVERDQTGADDAVLVHAPIARDTTDALMLTWIGDKGPESALDTDRLDQLEAGI